MKRTQSQNKRLYGLFAKLGIDEDTRRAIVSALTHGRTEHTSELTVDEAKELISALSDELRRANGQINREAQKLRRKVFQLFYELNWISSEMQSFEKLIIINNWIIQRTHTGKNDLNQLSISELKALINQLRAIKRNYEERGQKKTIKIVVAGSTQVFPNGMQICLN